jgi:hypothetical protein
VAAALGHGGGAASAWKPRPDARRPLRPSTEHVACVKSPDLETVSGPAWLRIWIWANYESCSFRDALHFLFRGHSH